MHDVTERPLTAEEERELIPLAQSGDIAARNRLITGNWRLMLTLARKHRGRVDFHDALQEMCLQLILYVIPNFRPGKGRLLNYATIAFRRHLQRVGNATTYPVKLPSTVMECVHTDRKHGLRQETIAAAARIASGSRDTLIEPASTSDPVLEAIVREELAREDPVRQEAVVSIPLVRFTNCRFWRAA